MNYQDKATKFWELHKAEMFPSWEQMIAIRQFAGWLDEVDSESNEPNGQDPDGTIDLGLAPLEEERDDNIRWCGDCSADVVPDEMSNCPDCPDCGAWLEEDDNGFNSGGEEWDE